MNSNIGKYKKRIRSIFWKIVELDKEEEKGSEKRFWLGGKLDSLCFVLKLFKDINYKERWE